MMRGIILVAIALGVSGCGRPAPPEAYTTQGSRKPAEQMSNTELKEAYLSYEWDHYELYSRSIRQEMLTPEALAKKSETDLPSVYEEVLRNHQQLVALSVRLKDKEANYARFWEPLGLRLLAPIDVGSPATMADLQKLWKQSRQVPPFSQKPRKPTAPQSD